MRPILSSWVAIVAAGTLLSCGSGNASGAEQGKTVDRAVARIMAVGDSGVGGLVRFERSDTGVHVTGRITGLSPGKHGFHVHQFGDLSDTATGKSAGGHFAPRGMPHGHRTDEIRHVGDLGNIEANADGIAEIDLTDGTIQLDGPYSILGRAIVVHADADQFVQPTGAAGKRVGFGVIGIAKPNGG